MRCVLPAQGMATLNIGAQFLGKTKIKTTVVLSDFGSTKMTERIVESLFKINWFLEKKALPCNLPYITTALGFFSTLFGADVCDNLKFPTWIMG